MLFKIHHIGIAVPSIEKALEFHTQALAMKQVSEIVHDKNLKVKVVLLAIDKQPSQSSLIELVEPAEPSSPIDRILKQKNSIYHYCIEVDSIENSLQEARKNHAIVTLKPTPAALFNGRKIAFIWTPDHYLLEFLESA